MSEFWRVPVPGPVAPPEWLSHTGLGGMEGCPHRWWLAQSGGSWGANYPAPLSAMVGRLRGRVVHRILERLLTGGAGRGRAELKVALVAAGGWRQLVGSTAEELLAPLGQNPRVPVDARDELLGMFRGGAWFEEVQTIVLRLLASVQPVIISEGTAEKGKDGAWVEAELRGELADGGWVGRLDLVVVDQEEVTIFDFKTGTSAEEGAEDRAQLLTYAVLWRALLGGSRFKLRLVHPDRVVELEAPTTAMLDRHQAELYRRGSAVRKLLRSMPPPTRPGDACGSCTMRHGCADYWKHLQIREGRHQDFEVEVVDREGDRLSMKVHRSSSASVSPGQTARLELERRSPRGIQGATVGMQLRLLDFEGEVLEDGSLWLRGREGGVRSGWGGGEVFLVGVAC